MDGARIISVENLRKTYKGFSEPALQGISLSVEKNEIFGLLGPNGAGKTTTIHILCGFVKNDSGTFEINGLNAETQFNEIKKIIGLVPQEIALYETMTARENLRFIGNMYGLSGKKLSNRIDECLNMLGLNNSIGKQIKFFSGGMKRRLNLIAGILHEPKVLFLDEPTVGIDVQSKNVIIEYLKKLNKNGTTIIYTSHYLEEAEELCTKIAIIDYGKIIIEGEPQKLIDSNPSYTDLESVFLSLTGRKLRDN